MQIGKDGGKSFVFVVKWRYGLSFFIPSTRNTWAIAGGFGWRVYNEPTGRFAPHLSFFVVRTSHPFCRMWHLRRPFNVCRVGTWRAPV